MSSGARPQLLKTVIGFYLFLISVVLVLAALPLITIPGRVEARGMPEPYVPEIIEVEKDHAWCYVLTNRQAKVVGNINILSCVPKE